MQQSALPGDKHVDMRRRASLGLDSAKVQPLFTHLVLQIKVCLTENWTVGTKQRQMHVDETELFRTELDFDDKAENGVLQCGSFKVVACSNMEDVSEWASFKSD